MNEHSNEMTPGVLLTELLRTNSNNNNNNNSNNRNINNKYLVSINDVTSILQTDLLLPLSTNDQLVCYSNIDFLIFFLKLNI